MKKLMQVRKYLPELAFIALLVKVLVTGAGMGEALAFISLVSSIAYTKWLDKYKDDRYSLLEKSSNDKHLAMETEITKIKQDFEDRIQTIENRVSSLSVDKGMRVNNEEKPKAGILGGAKRHF